MELVLGEEYSVSVIKFVSSGIIVKMSDSSTQLIHLSRLSSKFVSDPSNLVSIGQVLTARCVKGLGKPLELSILHLGLLPKRRPEHIVDKSKVESATESKPVKSLDDMIADMNAAFEDKMRSKRTREVRRMQSRRK